MANRACNLMPPRTTKGPPDSDTRICMLTPRALRLFRILTKLRIYRSLPLNQLLLHLQYPPHTSMWNLPIHDLHGQLLHLLHTCLPVRLTTSLQIHPIHLDSSWTYLQGIQLHYRSQQEKLISIPSNLLISNSITSVISSMMIYLKLCSGSLTPDWWELFGLHHRASSILNFAKTMEDHLPSAPQSSWMAYPVLHQLSWHRFRNLVKSIDDPQYFAQQSIYKGGFAAQEQPINSLAWKEPFHQSFLTRCSCHFVSTPACKFGLDWYKTWAVAATSEKIHLLAGNCQHHTHYSIRGKRLPDGTYISSLTAEYPSLMASAIVEILRPWVSQNSHCYNPILQWKTLLAKQPISRGPRITDGAGDISSANWTIPFCQDIFKAVRQKWCTRILSKHLHTHVTLSSQKHTTERNSSTIYKIVSLQKHRMSQSHLFNHFDCSSSGNSWFSPKIHQISTFVRIIG